MKENKEDDFKLTCSESDVEELKANKAWKDICKEVDIWRDAQLTLLEEEDDLKAIGRCQGRMQACRHFKELPEVFLEDILMTKGENKDE